MYEFNRNDIEERNRILQQKIAQLEIQRKKSKTSLTLRYQYMF